MHNKDFKNAYRASQEKITLSDEVREAIVGQLGGRIAGERGERSRDDVNGQPAFGSKYTRSVRFDGVGAGESAGRRSTAKRRRMLGALPVAACLAVLLMTAGLFVIPGMLAGQDNIVGEIVPDFSIKAYAAETDTLLETGDDSLIIFSRVFSTTQWMDKDDYLTTEGFYTGSLFRIQGEDIVRVQASISKGVLYRQTTEQVSVVDDPEKHAELVSWMPSKRGIGTYYGGYDSIGIPPRTINPGEDKFTAKDTVLMLKKLGSTIDIAVTEVSAEQSFGFWINEDYGTAGDQFQATDAIIGLYDGALLTITVTDSSGKAITQLIELHTGYVASTVMEDMSGNRWVDIEPELIDYERSGLIPNQDCVKTIYGKVIKTTEEPFPGSLDAANELEGVVGKPMDILPGGKSFELVRDKSRYPIDPENIHAPDEPLATTMSFESESAQGMVEIPCSIANLKTVKSKTLPDGLALADVGSGLASANRTGTYSDWEYHNRVTGELDGYTLDESGTPSDGFTWVMLSADITNTSGEIAYTLADRPLPGLLSVRDSDDRVSIVLVRSFWYLEDDREIALAPGETKTFRWLAVAPDFALSDPTLFIAIYGEGEQDIKGLRIDLE